MNSTAETVLVTGFPHALTSRTIELLSADTAVQIILLARNKDRRQAQALAKRLNKKASVITGDLGKIDFGLSGDEYFRLADQLTGIIHLEPPAAPGHGTTIGKARSASRELIELGLAAERLAHMIVLSHVDVAGFSSGPFTEHDLDQDQHACGPAGEDRFRAERIFNRFYDRLPITVIRTGWLVGQGIGLCPLVHLMLSAEELNALSIKHPHTPFYLSPVGAVAEVVAKLLVLPPTTGLRTLHLLPSPPASTGELFDQLHQMANELLPEGFHLAAGARRTLRRVDPHQGWSVKDFFKQQPHKAHLETTMSEQFFGQHEMSLPRIDRDDLKKLVVQAVESIIGFKQ